MNPEDLRHKTGTTSSGENPPANATTFEAETSENETPHFTKESPYPVEDEQLYLMQFKEKHDTLNFLVRGIQNASRQAYNVIKERWDEGNYYYYNRSVHQGLAKEYKDLKASHKSQMEDFNALLEGYQKSGDEAKVAMMQELIDGFEEGTRKKLNDIQYNYQYEGTNEDIYLLMQLPKEEAVRRTGRRTRSGTYVTLGIMEQPENYEYGGFSIEAIDITQP